MSLCAMNSYKSEIRATVENLAILTRVIERGQQTNVAPIFLYILTRGACKNFPMRRVTNFMQQITF